MKTTRVAGVTAARTSSAWKVKSGRGATSTTAAPAARAQTPYMSNAGKRHHDLRTDPAAGLDRRPHGADHRGEDAFIESVGQQQPARVDAQVRRRLAHDVVVFGVERHLLAPERVDRLEHAGRAAGGVLVEVKPQPARRGERSLVGAHLRVLTSIEAAWPVKPSARASAVTVGATRRSPAAVRRWTDTTRTKSAALRPPRNRAAAPVGRT